METQKIVNLLHGNDNDNSRFATKSWYIIDSESNGDYSQNDEIKFFTRSIEWNLCNYSDAFILVTENITAAPIMQLHKYYLKIVHHLKSKEQK